MSKDNESQAPENFPACDLANGLYVGHCHMPDPSPPAPENWTEAGTLEIGECPA